MNTYDRSGPGGISGNAFDRWVEKTDMSEDSTITKMQHQYWVTKQALSRKLGKKEDECIVASDAELDAKLELFRSIQESCSYLQRVIDKYQERLCNLAQEENAMGRFLKEAGKQDKTRAGKMMSAVGKSLSYSGQQRLTLRAPLIRLYQEVETFRQRAIEDTLQNVQSMEKARTEYRAALSWMKNISQELDPDTSKQLERFRKVQMRVRRGKANFDHQALDCLQKVDLLAAARCNMFSHALVLYQNTLLNFTKKSAQAYSTIANSFKGYQRYDFMVVKELAEPSTKLAQQTGGDQNKHPDDENDLDDDDDDDDDDNNNNNNNNNNHHHSNDNNDNDDDKLLFFDGYHDNVEEAQEAHSLEQQEHKEEVDKLVDFETIDENDINQQLLESPSVAAVAIISPIPPTPTSPQPSLPTPLTPPPPPPPPPPSSSSSSSHSSHFHHIKQLQEDFFSNGSGNCHSKNSELEKSLAELDLAMDSFTGGTSNMDFLNDKNQSLGSSNQLESNNQQSLQLLTSENFQLLDDILNSGPTNNIEWDAVASSDTFLPPGILKQSLGDATLGKTPPKPISDERQMKKGKQKGNSWLDLFAELDPLANNPIETLSKAGDSNAPA